MIQKHFLKIPLGAQLQKREKRPFDRHMIGPIQSFIEDMVIVIPYCNTEFTTFFHAEDDVLKELLSIESYPPCNVIYSQRQNWCWHFITCCHAFPEMVLHVFYFMEFMSGYLLGQFMRWISSLSKRSARGVVALSSMKMKCNSACKQTYLKQENLAAIANTKDWNNLEDMK